MKIRLGRHFFAAIILCTAGHIATVVGEECTASEFQFECPNVNECPDSGFSLVGNCLDCSVYLSTDYEENECFQRRLLNGKDNPNQSFLYRDIAGIVVWFVAAGLAIASGIGGGGVYFPMGILLLAFPPKASSGLSQASIFGASLGGLIVNLRNKHPFTYKIMNQSLSSKDISLTDVDEAEPNNHTCVDPEVISSVPTDNVTPCDTINCHFYTRPLIDYDIVLLLAPMEMSGAFLGVLVQTILPNWLYLMIAAVILGFVASMMYVKWWGTRREEIALELSRKQQQTTMTCSVNDSDCLEHQEKVAKQPQSPISPATPLSRGDTDDTSLDNGQKAAVVDDIVQDRGELDNHKIAQRDHLLKRESRQYPANKFFLLFVLWAGLTILTFMKGGKGFNSIVGITCADPWYGVIVAAQFLWAFGFAVLMARKIIKDTAEKVSVNYPFHPQDVLWNYKTIGCFALYSLAAGVAAGLVGIAGGNILGPILITKGLHPRVSTATTATMIVLTSSSVAIQFVVSGLVPWQYSVCFFFTCLVGAYVGKTHIDGYVRKTGKASVLILLLASFSTFACLGTLSVVFADLAKADWCFAGFNQFCDVSNEAEDVTCAAVDAVRMLQNSFVDIVGGSST